MKTQFLLSVVFLCLNFRANAQVDSVNIAFKNRMIEIFENVDFSQVPSGILYDRGTPIITFEPFKGQITEASKANAVIFGLAYASLTTMIVDSAAILPASEVLSAVTDTIFPNSDVIPVMGIHQVYHYIDSLAFEDSLFTIEDDNLSDVIGRSRSPYVQDEIFLFSPVELTMDNAAFSLYFDSNHFYSNTGKTVDSLLIDVGNGQGYLLIDFDQNIPVSFSESAAHNVKVRLVYTDNSFYESHFDLVVRQSALRAVGDTPDIIHDIEFRYFDGVNPTRGGGTINVFLACGRERIEKPFIWAEAYNPALGIVQANLLPDDILGRLDHEDGRFNEKSLLDYLEENGYDIIVLDYDNGTDYLGNTAEFIKEAIRWINLQKHSAGSSAKNVLLGQSMGGVASMQALREMENEDENHETETFIVFDSPIRGVNIPMAAQASLLDIATIWVNKPFFGVDEPLYKFVEPIRDVIRLLYEPATRTMITNQSTDIRINGAGPNIPEHLSYAMGVESLPADHLYDWYYDYLHGEMGGMPEDCEVIVIANGSQNGSEQGYVAGERIIRVDEDYMLIGSIIAGYFDEPLVEEGLDVFGTTTMNGSFGLLAWLVGGSIEINLEFFAMKEEAGFCYYRSEIDVFPWWMMHPMVFHSNEVRISNGLEIDHEAGGFFGLGNNGLFIQDTPFAAAVPEFKLHTWCFTPTGSVLNYEDETGGHWQDNLSQSFNDRNYNLTNNLTKDVDMYLANRTGVTFDNDPIEGRLWSNTAHTWFTSDQTKFLLYFLEGQDDLEGVSDLSYGKTYNYGKSAILPSTDFEGDLPIRTSSILAEDLTVNATNFNVNANDIIGLTPNIDYLPTVLGNAIPNSHFVIYLGPLCDPTPKVTLQLESSAEMNIGDGDTRTGSVLVQDGHQITVKSGATLHIKKGSTLKLNDGGLLFVEDGGTIVIEDGGSLITEEGSEIHYFEGAALELNGEDSRLDLGGILHLHENAFFNPTHVGVNSGIIIINNADGAIVAETGSKIRILGDSDTDPMLTINENAKLIAPSELDEIFIGSCKVIIRSSLDLPLQTFTNFKSINAFYTVQSNLVEAGVHPKIGLFDKSYITTSRFEDVLVFAEEMVPTDGYFLVVNQSEFELTYAKSDYMLEMANGNISINYCEFDHFSGQALRLYGLTSFSIIANSAFTAEPYSEGYAVFKVAENELAIKNTTFTGGKVGVYNSQGQLSLRCNNFSTMSQMGVFGGYNSRVEMSLNHKQGYNSFDNMTGGNVILNHANFLSLSNGYNYFWDNGNTSIIEGTVTLDLPGALTLPGSRNQWNVLNTAPSASDIEVYTDGTTDEIPYYTNPTMSATCGTQDPTNPIVVAVDGQSGIYLPHLSFAGFTGMRLDSAYATAIANTHLWNESKNDAQAISYFHEILTTNYSVSALARPETQYFLDQTYAAMKFTIGHAISDSTILKVNNTSSFETTVQKYVDVLNLLTQEDTFSITNYHKRFALELDKANLFRMLGHTDKGLDILQNVSFCDLDSSERIALNELMLIYESESIKRSIGESAYGIDSNFVDITTYQTPSSSQATEFTFGSVINSLSSVTYRSCTNGSMKPEEDETNRSSFTIYPNPSDGIVNLIYKIPSERQAELIVYSINGQVIYRTWLNEGSTTAIINLSNVESGLYLYTVMIDGAVEHAGRISIAN